MSSIKPNDARSSVEVMILGQRMVLKVEKDRARVERLASYVREKAEELERQFRGKQPLPPAKLAALLAINIADDYFSALDENRAFKREVAQRSRELLADLES
jgi:cell division protein ZapA (FtsZ GTPase activity inhibitor)